MYYRICIDGNSVDRFFHMEENAREFCRKAAEDFADRYDGMLSEVSDGFQVNYRLVLDCNQPCCQHIWRTEDWTVSTYETGNWLPTYWED